MYLSNKQIPIFYHGKKAELKKDDLIESGFQSNYGSCKYDKFVYHTETLDAAIWGAKLAIGAGKGHIYIFEPTGTYEDDPNLTHKKFPGNNSKSYPTAQAIIVIDELDSWLGHSSEQLNAMRANLDKLSHNGIGAIED
jgi:hypothetical protein